MFAALERILSERHSDGLRRYCFTMGCREFKVLNIEWQKRSMRCHAGERTAICRRLLFAHVDSLSGTSEPTGSRFTTLDEFVGYSGPV